jgi:hypothetical protein
MYPDPKRVRHHRIAINLNDFEYDVIESLSNWLGIDKSRLVREMVMRDAKSLLLDEQPKPNKDETKVTNQSL